MMAGKADFANMSLDELVSLREKIDQQVATVAATEVAALESRLEALKGIAGAPKTKPASKAPAPKKKASAKKVSKRGPKKGTKVAAKYADKKTGNSWSGRGLTPQWIKEHEAAGGKREDFAV